MDNRQMHDIITYEYIGIPYAQMNCWQLVAQVQSKIWNRRLPQFSTNIPWTPMRTAQAFRRADSVPNWHAVEIFENGDIVLMGRGKTPTHAGIYFNDHILHTTQALNACLTPVQMLPNMGYTILKGYSYAEL